MSHELDETTGQAAMAYVETEGRPWHGLGRPIKEGATPAEIEEAAGLKWPVLMRPVKFDMPQRGLEVEMTDLSHRVMFRGDTGAVLDITGPGYVPHQNREVLEFFAEYLDAGQLFIDTAGSLKGGQQIWVQAKLGHDFKLPGKDEVKGRILLMNPHQYGKGMIAKVVAERVVCWNTLGMAMGETGGSIKIWHTKEFNKARQDKVKRDLGIAGERMDAFKADAKVLVELRLDTEQAVKVLAKGLGENESLPLAQQGRTVTRMMELFGGLGKGAKLASADGTGWGLLNAVTQFYDHEYGRTQEARLQHAWLGSGDINKRRVYATLLAEARAGA